MMKKYLNLFDLSQKVDYKIEILSGLTVALALIPEAVAFALIAGLSPLTGLYAAFVMGLVTSILGGRPGMISGATGAVAVVLVTLAQSHGVVYTDHEQALRAESVYKQTSNRWLPKGAINHTTHTHNTVPMILSTAITQECMHRFLIKPS